MLGSAGQIQAQEKAAAKKTPAGADSVKSILRDWRMMNANDQAGFFRRYVKGRKSKGLSTKLGIWEAIRDDVKTRTGRDGKTNPRERELALAQKYRMPAFGVKSSGIPGSGGSGIGILAAPSAPVTPAQRLSWEFLGPRNMTSRQQFGFGPRESFASGRVNAATYDPRNPLVAYAASAGGGIWKTINGGVTWIPLSDNIAASFPLAAPDPKPFNRLETSCVAVSPANSNVVYVGSGDFPGSQVGGYGLLKSTDGGVTWKVIQLPLFETNDGFEAIGHIVIDPDNPDRMWLHSILDADALLGGTTGGFFQSDDAGETWTKVSLPGINQHFFQSISIGARDDAGRRSLYVTALDVVSGEGAVLQSNDRGATWSRLTIPLRIATVPGGGASSLMVAASPTNPNAVFVFEGTSNGVTQDGRFFYSESAGAPLTWVDITGNFPILEQLGQIPYNLQFTPMTLATPSGLKDAVGFGALGALGNVGSTPDWQDITRTYSGIDTAHTDQHGMAVEPFDSSRSLITNDGGVYGVKYDSAANTFLVDRNQLSASLGVTQFYHADWHPTNPSIMVGGTQDNGSPATIDGDLFNWDSITGGDGFTSAINQASPNIIITTSQFLNINASNNGGLSFSRISPVWNPGGPFFSAFGIDNTKGGGIGGGFGVIYAGVQNLWRYGLPDAAAPDTTPWTENIGNTTLTTLGSIRVVAVHPKDPNVVYVGTDDGRIWVTFNSQASTVDANGVRTYPANLVTWKELTDALGDTRPSGSILSISPNPDIPTDVLIGFGGSDPLPRLWRCSNTAAALPVLAPVSGIQLPPGVPNTTALPITRIWSITRVPGDFSNSFVVGTDVGVFVSLDGGSTWADLGRERGLPPVPVRTVGLVPGTNMLNVATFGRGFWRIPARILGAANFEVIPGLARSAPNTVRVLTRIRNSGGPAKEVRITAMRIRDLRGPRTVSTSTPLPVTLPDIDPESEASTTLNFTTSATSPARGSTVIVDVTISAVTGGSRRTFLRSIRTRMP